MRNRPAGVTASEPVPARSRTEPIPSSFWLIAVSANAVRLLNCDVPLYFAVLRASVPACGGGARLTRISHALELKVAP